VVRWWYISYRYRLAGEWVSKCLLLFGMPYLILHRLCERGIILPILAGAKYSVVDWQRAKAVCRMFWISSPANVGSLLRLRFTPDASSPFNLEKIFVREYSIDQGSLLIGIPERDGVSDQCCSIDP